MLASKIHEQGQARFLCWTEIKGSGNVASDCRKKAIITCNSMEMSLLGMCMSLVSVCLGATVSLIVTMVL